MNKSNKIKQRVLNANRRSETVKRNEDVRMGVVFDEVFDASYEISLEKPDVGSEDGPTAVCSCGDWRFGPSTSLKELASAAKQHVDNTGHPLRSH